MSSPDRINPGDVGINKVNMDELQLIPTRPADAILALAAHRRPIASLCSSLAALPDLLSIEDTSTLALTCLALDYRCGLSTFGVIV